MSKSEISTAQAFAFVVAALLAIFLMLLVVTRWWGWHVRNWQAFSNTVAGNGSYYCKQLKKILQADPIFEDNGKYEDESYRVTYDDGSVGLVDQAQLTSGYYCESSKFILDHETVPEGWVLKP